MQKRGEVQKGFFYIVIIILAVAVLVSYLGTSSSSTGRVIGTTLQTEEDVQSQSIIPLSTGD